MATSFRAFLALGAVFCVSGAVASTPDGATPSDETVCDGYSGAAFGLCNAYCEAMDCDADPNADQAACDTVGAKFTARTGEAPPCEKREWFCEDAEGGATADPTEKCPAKDGTLTCTFGESATIWYCETAKWDEIGKATQDACFATECEVSAPAPTCADFGSKDIEGSYDCKVAPGDTQIACTSDGATVEYCDTTTGKCQSMAELCSNINYF